MVTPLVLKWSLGRLSREAEETRADSKTGA
jgi:hypothetical protein